MFRSLLIEGKNLVPLKYSICKYLCYVSILDRRYYRLKMMVTTGHSKNLLTAAECPEYDEWLIVHIKFEKKYRETALELCKGIKKLSDLLEDCHFVRLNLGFADFGLADFCHNCLV